MDDTQRSEDDGQSKETRKMVGSVVRVLRKGAKAVTNPQRRGKTASRIETGVGAER